LVEYPRGRPEEPAWRLVLRGAGWFVIAVGSLFSITNPLVPLPDRIPISLALVGLLGNLSAAVLFGRLLVVAASAEQSERRVHRLGRWARLLRIVGLLLCVSWPCFVLGDMLQRLEIMRRLGAEAFFHLTYLGYLAQVLPAVLLGLVAIGYAEMSGRRKPPPEISDVFS
jgi:hypothetical protein